MNNRRTKQFTRIIISQLGIASLMFLLGLSLVFYAEGYRFRFNNFKIVKTGLVFLISNQKAAEVYINNVHVASKTPYSQNLLPGVYDLTIKKDGYSQWSNHITIKPELVTDFREIILFKKDITPVKLIDQSKINFLNSPIEILATSSNHKLVYNDYEIWLNDELVTRFSKPLLRAVWYPDYKHIVYQQESEIRLIETTGTNDTFLVKLNQEGRTNFIISRDGNELYFADNGEYKITTIR